MLSKSIEGCRSALLRYGVALSLLLALVLVAPAPQAYAAPLPGTIAGTVTAAVSGSTIADISVFAYKQTTIGWEYAQFAVTDLTGDYLLSGLAPGTYMVSFSDNAGTYLSEYYDGSPTDVGATPVTVAAEETVPGINASMELAGRITGTVTELAGGGPLFDIQVAVYEIGADPTSPPYAWTLTDADGFYDIGGLPTGLYRVMFTDWTQMYAPEFYNGAFSFGAATPVVVTEPDTTSLIDAALSNAATISGRVTSDGVNGIPDVMVQAYKNVVGENYEWQSETVTTDADGYYSLVGLPTGDFVVGFYDTSGLYVYQQFYDGEYLLQNGTPVSATVGADTGGIDAVLPEFATITGTVTGSDTGLPLEGEWVEVYRDNAGVWELMATVVTNPDGTYDTGPIPPGTYRARFGATSIVYKAEYYAGALLESEATSFVVAAGGTATDIDASLDPVDTDMTVSSANQPVGSFVGLGTTHVVDGFTLERTAGAASIGVTDVTIQNDGTAPASDVVAGVEVYRDNGDGSFDASDVLLNSTQGVFAGDSAIVTFDAPETVSTTQQYWTVYEFANATANGGDTARSLVASLTATGANSIVNNAVPGDFFTIDSHGPDVTIWVPGNGEVLFQDPATITGSATDLSGVESAEIRILRSDGKFWTGTAWVDAETWIPAALDATGTADTGFSYDWAFEPATQDATSTYDIDARASNSLGSQNLGYALPVTGVTIENTPPLVEITSLANGAVLTGSSAEVTGTASDTSGVFMVYLTIQRDSDGAFWDGFAWNAFPANITANGTDNWSYTWTPFDPAYQQGTETYTIQAFAGDFNNNGAASTAVTGVTIDNAVGVTVDATGVDKTYDGTNSADVTLSSADFMVGDDVSATYTTATFDNRNVGTGKTVNVSGIALSGTDAGKYTLLNTTASTSASITALDITGEFTADDKVYDGNTDATVLTRSLVGTITGDDVALDGGLAQFDTSGVGTGKTVTLLGATLSGADADNYNLTSVADTTADITARELTGSFTVDNRPYDGTANASVATSSVAVAVVGDEVGLTGGTVSFADKDVANGKTVTWTGATLAGADKDNYTLAPGPITTTADITPLDITGAFTADDKVYDGNTDATVLTRSLVGTITGYDVALDGGLAQFDTSAVGTGKTVTLLGATLSGADSGNYNLVSVADTTADITAKELTIDGALAENKVYDGSTDATVTFTGATLVGVVLGDVVTIDSSAYTALFDTADVGTGKDVTVTGVALSGDDSGNYTVAQPSGLTADVTAKELTIDGALAEDKVYDGSTDATVTFTGATLVGVVLGDVVTIDSSAYSASFDTKNVGTGKDVTVTGVALAGGDSGNYTVAQPSGLTADITALDITGAFTADDKVYDGTTDATVLTRSLIGTITGDVVTLDDGTAAFDTKDVGTGKTVTLTGATLGGADADNYTLTSVADTTADITALDITGAFTADDKVYDGTTDATVLTRSLVGTITGDDVTLDGGTAAFDTKDVGTGKTVTLTGATLGGADAVNYNLTSVADTTADITAKELTISGALANDKPYDGTTDATVNFAGASLVGTVTGDVVAIDSSGYSASFDTAAVGTGKDVTVTGVTLSGADSGNYSVAQPAGLTADITARAVTVTADDVSKLVDAADPALTYTVTSGSLVAGDAFTGALTRAAGEAAGTYPITQGTLALTSNYNLTFVPGTFSIVNKDVKRLGGSTRYTTAVTIAKDAYPGWVGVTHVVLASGEDAAQPDALTAAGLAGVLDAPLLLVPYSSVNNAVENAIRAMPAGVKVHIIGGSGSAVSTNVERQVRGYANVASVDRVAGSTRYGTAAAVARRMKVELVAQGETLPTTTMITNGNFPAAMFDALTASAISAHNHFPVLLVKNDSVPGETSSVLSELGLTQRYIIGGPTSVNSSVATRLGVAASHRIAGPTRYSTATEAAKRAKAEGWLSNVIVGLAAQVPDAATGGAYMGKNDGALVYVTATSVPRDTDRYLTDASASIESAVVFGGTTSVSESVRMQISNLIN